MLVQELVLHLSTSIIEIDVLYIVWVCLLSMQLPPLSDGDVDLF